MQEVEKTTVKRQQSTKRQHRRTRHNGAYIMLIVCLVAGIAFALSVTRLFNVTTVTIENDTDTSSDRLIEICGFKKGDNLMRMDTRDMAKRIEQEVVYAENVSVRRELPSTLVIHVEKAVPVANIQSGDEYLIISESGRILETPDSPREGLLIVTGYQAKEPSLGAWLQAEDSRQDTVLKTMMAAVEDSGEPKADLVDMHDTSEIEVHFGENILFRMGSSSDAAYKLKFAAKSIEKINPGKKYRLTMVGHNQISVLPEDMDVPRTPAKPTENGTDNPPIEQIENE